MGLRLTVRSGWGDATRELVYEFDQARVVIGRRAGSDVLLPNTAVSSHHATLIAADSGYALVDESSTNGTRVGGQPIPAGRRKPLRPGDRIELGGFRIEVDFRAVAAATSAEQTAALALRLLRDARAGEPLEGPSLIWLNGPDEGRRQVLPPPPSTLVVGRAEDCGVRIDDADCSRKHAELRVAIDGIAIEHYGGPNELQVGGRIVRHKRLRDRDEVLVGSTLLAFADPAHAILAEVLERADESPELPEVLDSVAEPSASAAIPVPPDPEGVAQELSPDVAEAPPPEILQGPRTASGSRADLVIYALAGTVLAASVAALLWLLQSG